MFAGIIVIHVLEPLSKLEPDYPFWAKDNGTGAEMFHYGLIL